MTLQVMVRGETS